MVGKALSPLAPLCKGELLLQCEALPTIEGLLTEVSEKRKGCGRKAIPPVVARILSGDSTSPLTREASLVRSDGLLSFYNGCEKGYIRCDNPTLFEGNWYGQLMTSPQIFAYLLQIEYWLRRYDVRIDRQ